MKRRHECFEGTLTETRKAITSGLADSDLFALRVENINLTLRVYDPRPDDSPMVCLYFDPDLIDSNNDVRAWFEKVVKSYGGVVYTSLPDGESFYQVRIPRA